MSTSPRTSLAGRDTTTGGSHTKIVTSLIIEFTPIFGPRVKRTLEGNGDLSADQREWLVQFITKDLLHLQQLAMTSQLRKRQNKSPPRPAATRNSGPQGGPQPSHSNSQSQQNSSSVGVPHSSSANSLEDYSQERDNSFVKVICLDQLNVAVVVMFFSLENDAPGGSTDDIAGILGSTHMYAVAVALQNFSTIRLRVALPTIRDWLFFTHEEILSLATVGDDDEQFDQRFVMEPSVKAPPGIRADAERYFSRSSGAPVANTTVQGAKEGEWQALPMKRALMSISAPGSVDIEQEWFQRLEILNPLIDTWITERIDRDKMDPTDSTIFASNRWSASQLYAILVAVLSHHRCIIRADDELLVDRWLSTIALFLPDDRLLFASMKCKKYDSSIHGLSQRNFRGDVDAESPLLAPDLNLQGTTATVPEIIQWIHYFRCPPVIIDVGRRLSDPSHFFPIGTLTFFTETRRKIFKREKSGGADSFMYSKVQLSSLKNSSLIAGICARLRQISVTNPVVVVGPVGTTTTPGSISNSSMVSLKTITSGQPPNVAPLFPATADPEALISAPFCAVSVQKMKCMLDAIAHWRKQLLLKAMTFYVSEIELRRDAPSTNLHNHMKISDADHRVMQVSVDFIAQVQEAKEKRVRDVLHDTFAF